MPYYNCKVAEESGKVQHLKYFADSIDEIKQLVAKDGYLLLDITEVYTVSTIAKRRFNLRDFLTFNQELYILIKAGQPLVRALEIILEKLPQKKGIYRVIESIRKDIAQGYSLSEAMEKFPEYFPLLYISNVKAGERGGNLVERLKEYQIFMKKTEEMRRKIVSASVYPIMVLSVIVAAVIFLFTYVIPNFSKIYLEANVDLPMATVILLKLTDIFKVVLPFLILAIILGFIFVNRIKNTFKGKLLIDDFKLKIPFISTIYKNYLVSNFARTLSAIVKGGIPLVTALKITSNVSTNASFSEKLKKATKLVEEGNSLSLSLEETDLFPSIALRLIKSGEGTGSLSEMLDEVAEYYDNLVVDALTMVTTLVEPALMIVMGFVVGIIVIAMYLPIFSLAGAVGG
ncbi:MAG: type II secretion system F family protein [Proteobacteria bacterium]|nr:type II secretion system F family protein [Pseudomonadota bacterium]